MDCKDRIIINGKMYCSDHFWFAVMDDTEDYDWGYGSDDLDTAIDMLRRRGRGLICVIDDGDDPVALATLTYLSLFGEEEQ